MLEHQETAIATWLESEKVKKIDDIADHAEVVTNIINQMQEGRSIGREKSAG